MADAIERLAEAVRQRSAILFVGAGATSVSLPSWDKLIRHVEDELGIEREDGNGNDSYQSLA